MNDRLRRLQSRIGPSAPAPTPGIDLTLKLMAHARAELDYQDRHADASEAGRGRLEAGAEPPEPLALSLDERRELLRNAEWFLCVYIPEQRSSDQGPDTTAALDDMEVSTRENITKLREEITIMEAMEGSKTND